MWFQGTDEGCMHLAHEYDLPVAWLLESVSHAPFNSHCVYSSVHLAAEDKDCARSQERCDMLYCSGQEGV